MASFEDFAGLYNSDDEVLTDLEELNSESEESSDQDSDEWSVPGPVQKAREQENSLFDKGIALTEQKSEPEPAWEPRNTLFSERKTTKDPIHESTGTQLFKPQRQRPVGTNRNTRQTTSSKKKPPRGVHLLSNKFTPSRDGFTIPGLRYVDKLTPEQKKAAQRRHETFRQYAELGRRQAKEQLQQQRRPRTRRGTKKNLTELLDAAAKKPLCHHYTKRQLLATPAFARALKEKKLHWFDSKGKICKVLGYNAGFKSKSHLGLDQDPYTGRPYGRRDSAAIGPKNNYYKAYNRYPTGPNGEYQWHMRRYATKSKRPGAKSWWMGKGGDKQGRTARMWYQMQKSIEGSKQYQFDLQNRRMNQILERRAMDRRRRD